MGNYPFAQTPVPAFPSDCSYATGEGTFARALAYNQLQLITQNAWFSYFTAQRSETVDWVTTYTAANGATITYGAISIYTVDSAGNLTQVGTTGDLHASIWASSFTMYTEQLTAPFSKVAGQQYAIGVLAVGSGTPNLLCAQTQNGAPLALAPALFANLSGQSSLPSSVAAGSLAFSSYGAVVQAVLSPASTP
jgi:hypothetical protein